MSNASCRINNMNSIVNQQKPDWGLLLCSDNNGNGTYQGYVNRHGDISWMLLNLGSGNIVTGGTALCDYNTTGTDSFNPNAPL
jgi:hypothetical protein